MSVWSTIMSWFNRPLVNVTFSQEDVAAVLGQSPAQLYKTQPHLRTVISFMGDNVGQVGLQLFSRKSDVDRERVTDDPLVALINRPNPDMTQFELLRQLVSDIALYDVAYWIVVPADSPSGWIIRPIPPAWVTMKLEGDVFSPSLYKVQPPAGNEVSIPADDMIVFHGWNPEDPTNGVSPIRALKDVISEQMQAWSFRTQMWRRGGRIGMYLSRPKDAPKWDDKARERFERDWKQFQDKGAKAGSTPLIEDGMTMNRVGFSAREDEFLEVTKLSLQTVAQVYHVNPVMVGVLDNANFSNTREFRKMLYSETLGPVMRMIQDRLNAFLVPKVARASNPYLEFNIRAKLAGDFEEQASVLSTSVGAPWMTVNEARGLQNYPALNGGDDLIVPLNVMKGGQSNPQDGGDPLPVDAQPKAPDVPSADDLQKLVNAAGVLIRSGFEPQAALEAVGLPHIDHTGAMPVALRDEDTKSVVGSWLGRLTRSVDSKTGAGVDADWGRWERELQADLVIKAHVDAFTAGRLAKAATAGARESSSIQSH